MTRGVITSPFVMEVADYQNNRIHIEIPFNTTSMAIINPGLTGTRDVGCRYDTFQLGRDAGIKSFPIPEGSFTVGRQQLANQGFATINDVMNSNVTFADSTQV